MRKAIFVLALVGFVAGPAWASGIWDQLCPCDTYGGHSTIDYDTPMESTSADDFLCTGTGPITAVDFNGWSYYGESYLAGFRIGFWSDVPATPDDESHPGDLLWTRDYDTFTYVDPPECVNASNQYHIDMSADPFVQEEDNIYWVSIQGIMVDDGYGDTFYWNFRDRNEDMWGDDAAFASDYFGFAPWANWGWPDMNAPDLYEGAFPAGWAKSADMSFRLVPEPASLLLLGLSLVALRRR